MLPSDRTLGVQGKQDYVYHQVPQTVLVGEPGLVPLTAVGPDGQPIIMAAMAEPQVQAAGGLAGECQAVMGMLCQWINILLVFVPLGIVSHYQEWGALTVFGCNFMAIVPLAGILGGATEVLAVHTGQMIGGLLNATFGNAVEMIVTVNAIKAGLVAVVQGSLIGSILSNMLLVLGMAFFAAGLVQKESKFNATGASANMVCLSLGAVALALPTVYHHIEGITEGDVLDVSRISSAVIATVYILFLVFQLGTHAEMFVGGEEEEEEASMSIVTSATMLLAATCCVAFCSEFLVDSIEGVTEEYGLPEAFIGVILLPIVGNAAEHATAVTVAVKGKMDLAMGVAVGSSTQIALLVVPFSVIVGWTFDVPMSLDFRIFDSSVMMLSVFVVNSALKDGTSNWLEGAILMAIYVLVAIICWFIPER
eukprot:TRINITY_DN105743_c0_g1_i1.p1 TRINITY_DN105743_c0_g1~~TRINITY_DN105743_c0_g1_i1.p1  ORF type:complete len:422 (-),score=69.98 TRINITY_DN105743_c0_g1_i1:34-1299(-)